ncbi:ABC transporter substrate-binding protein [Thalassobacillus pellis]|uniref:ABC transporter substrate-binding protein n=1 Tax=Thalassobacillus pellis TaxID=748008 RepID=UPI0019605868|nr:sugar ABC transporter substrate-binding protein [Thalassobacillus pellis]MBM7551581.1 multiple sugar transport system substrate-binding protein [Thalassobacillus pellis]
MRKILSLSLIVLLSVLAACSSSANDTGGDGGNSESVTITLGMWDEAQVDAYEPVVKKFEEENPDINVKLQPTPWEQYWTKLETAATGSVLPDVFWMNGPNIIKYASNDILLPLDKYMEKSDVKIDKFPQSLVDLYNYEDTQYAIPKDFDTVALFYNKELFDKAGVAYPDDTWDWDDLEKAAKKLTNKEEGIYGIAAKLNNQSNYYNTIYQAGGYVVSDDMKDSGYDEPETIKGLKFWTDLIHEHEASPTLAQMTDTTPRAMFESGKVAMLYDGSWMAKVFHENETLKGKIDVAELPKNEQRATIIHGIGHVIAANTEHPDAAWKLVEYLASEEANKMFSEAGSFIPAYEGMQEDWVKAIPEMNLQVFIDSLEYAVPYPSAPNTTEWQTLEQEYFPKAWTGEASVEEVAKDLAKEMEEILNK